MNGLQDEITTWRQVPGPLKVWNSSSIREQPLQTKTAVMKEEQKTELKECLLSFSAESSV
jgi:hypothetical protein